jgi:multiple sugar transport system ATP-binding protein
LKIASNGRDGWKVKVGLVELLGAETIAHLKTADGQMLQLRAEGSLALRDGETVMVTAEENLVHVFDRKGRAAARSGTGGTAKDAAKIVVLKKGGRK